MKRYILLDIGGTQIKGGSCDEQGRFVENIRYYPAYAQEKKDVILDYLASIIKDIGKDGGASDILGVGMAFSGYNHKLIINM